MPAPIPVRTRNVFFLGAGFSRALGLPNTAELLTEVHNLAKARNLLIGRRLREAYKYFYPEEATTFVPDVVDFFSVLRAYEDISVGKDGAPRFAGGFRDHTLLTDLRFIVVRLLCEQLRAIPIPNGGWPSVDAILQPGNVIVTSNWDLFVEWYATRRNIRLRLGGAPHDATLTLIKLHGSVDWTEPGFRNTGYPNADYSALRELQNSTPPYAIGIKADDMLRIRAVENMGRSWQFIKARTKRPHMVMMAQGKTVDMGTDPVDVGRRLQGSLCGEGASDHRVLVARRRRRDTDSAACRGRARITPNCRCAEPRAWCACAREDVCDANCQVGLQIVQRDLT